MKRQEYELSFTKPEGFYGSTSMIATKTEATKDVFQIGNYHDLADAPMMYNQPDTTVLNVGGAEVLISVYSPNKIVTSSDVAASLEGLLEAQKNYLGGELPIKKYAFIIYLFSGNSGSGSMGALEHSYSSLYYLPEANPRFIMPTIVDVSAHEFFHIVTPLNIHSEEIHYFDFNSPKMSRHLWMYEGVTEYFSHHVQVNQGMTDIDEFLNTMRDKILDAEKNYKTDLAFTELSLQCLGEHEEEYGNVYQKGALIGMCLDLKLNKLSDGKYHLMDLMKDLSKTYGKTNPFKDEELFDKITELTFPEVRQFFKDHVEDGKALPFKELLADVGINYEPEFIEKDLSFGNVAFGINQEDKTVVVFETDEMDEVGKDLGFEENDVILEINGEEVNLENAREVFSSLRLSSKDGDKLTILVGREGKKGKTKKKKLKGTIKEIERTRKHLFAPVENMSAEQVKLLRSWINWQ